MKIKKLSIPTEGYAQLQDIFIDMEDAIRLERRDFKPFLGKKSGRAGMYWYRSAVQRIF